MSTLFFNFTQLCYPKRNSFRRQTMRKVYSKEQMSNIIERYYTGVSPTVLSNETGIARSTIYAYIGLLSQQMAGILNL